MPRKAKKSKSRKAAAPRKTARTRKSILKSVSRPPARAAAKTGARSKAGVAKAKKSPARKSTAKKPPARKQVARKQIIGEGDYAASRKFLEEQGDFVKRNEAKIPALGREAEQALDGPDGEKLRAAEEEARSRSRTEPI